MLSAETQKVTPLFQDFRRKITIGVVIYEEKKEDGRRINSMAPIFTCMHRQQIHAPFQSAS
jgi:hypothetical protein